MNDMDELLAIMAQLRDPHTGCPWDRAQTFATIAPYTLEEAYEVADAIAQGDMASLREELGDLLFQVVFHARMAEETGHFGYADVVAAITDKLVRRHPHVFGGAEIRPAEALNAHWEAQKATERAAKGAGSVLAGVSVALPGTTRAVKLQRRAARVGFDWTEMAPVLDKIEEELREVREELAAGADPARMEHEVGDLLFSCTNLARHVNVDPESALRAANTRFERRFQYIEARLRDEGITPTEAGLERMEALWQEAKGEEAKGD